MVVAHVGCVEYSVMAAGLEIPMAALHAICTKASHRGRGLASALIQEALDWTHDRYAGVLLFTEIPSFYEKLSFTRIPEYCFKMTCEHQKGRQSLLPLVSPKDDVLFQRCFRERASISNHLWVKDHGGIASFNTLFATYPTYWSLHYSPLFDGIISFEIQGRTLYLFDVVAKVIPSLAVILDHIPTAIEEIYFYFPPDLLTGSADPEGLLCNDSSVNFSGYLMVHGDWPVVKPFTIPPLSRC